MHIYAMTPLIIKKKKKKYLFGSGGIEKFVTMYTYNWKTLILFINFLY